MTTCCAPAGRYARLWKLQAGEAAEVEQAHVQGVLA